jgi:hypothetical protein
MSEKTISRYCPFKEMLRKSYVRCCEYGKEVGELKDLKKNPKHFAKLDIF